MVAALREAGRVAAPGAPVAIQVFGRPDRCDLEAMKAAVSKFRPARPDTHRQQYWRPGIVEESSARRGCSSTRRST